MNEMTAPLYSRLYGMAQHLIFAQVQGQELGTVEPRGVVEKQDASDAVLYLAVALDELVQNGVLPVERGSWIMSLAMVARDYIEPLPLGMSEDGLIDEVDADLAEMVDAIREARSQMN